MQQKVRVVAVWWNLPLNNCAAEAALDEGLMETMPDNSLTGGTLGNSLAESAPDDHSADAVPDNSSADNALGNGCASDSPMGEFPNDNLADNASDDGPTDDTPSNCPEDRPSGSDDTETEVDVPNRESALKAKCVKVFFMILATHDIFYNIGRHQDLSRTSRHPRRTTQ